MLAWIDSARAGVPRAAGLRIRRCGAAPVLLLWVLLLAAGTVRAEAPFSFDTTPGRLPKSVVPRHYTIRLRPDLEKFTTRGSLTVDLEVRQGVKQIVLNALELEVSKATISADETVVALEPAAEARTQTVTLSAPREIAPGHYRLNLEFSGKIGEQAQGLFYVKYQTAAGPKVMLGTQMEPSDARRMFPCWDEPVFRATYDLTVVVPANHLAISNLPVKRETALAGGTKEVQFERTPPMASYLVALVSGELEVLEGKAEGVQIRIVTTAGKREQGRYALAATKKLLGYYNQYFGLKYPLPKLDQIALPGGFPGAMENWGAITYSETMLLFDPKSSSQRTKQDVFVTVAHEMAHQWFGNLVTTAWWDNLWLNEGFASWMEVKATDHFYPDWQMWLNAGTDKSGVMSADARSTTHALQQAVENESQANDAFDSITYSKGQALLRMLETYLGEETFRQGVHRYLAGHLYSNTTTADLWDALGAVSGKPVRAIAAGWTEQPGFPIVKLSRSCVNGQPVLGLQQSRFTVDDPAATSLEWKVPVELMDLAHPRAPRFTLLESASNAVTFASCGSVVKANAGDTGYYRVAYDPELLRRLRSNLNQLPPADRLNLLNDSWALVEAGTGSVTDYLELAESLHGEKTAAIWNQVLGTLDFLDELERGRPGAAAFREYACALLRPQLHRLGWEPRRGERGTETLLRAGLITHLGTFGDPAVIAECRARLDRFLADPESLAGDLRTPVVTVASRYADAGTYERIHTLARRATGTEERELYYHALAGALDPQLARATLAISLTDETSPQEAAGLVGLVAGPGEHPELAWDFARQHLPELLGKLESFDRNMYVPSIMRAFSDADRANELEAYVRENVSEDAVIKAREAAAAIRLKASLKRREVPVLDQWVGHHAIKEKPQ